MQRLEIAAYGTVRSGWVEIEATKDKVSYKGEITVKVIFSTKTVPFSGHLDQAGVMDPASYPVGSKKQIGDVAIESVDLGEGIHLAVQDPKLNLTGVVAAAVGVTGVLQIIGARLQAVVKGVTLHVVARNGHSVHLQPGGLIP